MPRDVELFGASVRGPANRRRRRGNQDAWACAGGTWGSVAVACDGLGSRTDSAAGARSACRAVKRAARLWPGVTVGADPRHLLRLVEVIWRLELAPRDPRLCATTCAFAMREPGGHMVLAGLGDTLVVLGRNDGSIEVLGEREATSFGSETLGLGTPHSLDDWWIAVEPPGPRRTVLLATDGVADDLDRSRLLGLMDWLSDELLPMPPRERWHRLCRELREWPVPGHVDDKTIAVLAEGGAHGQR